ncbi:hypothetical protein AB0J63_27500 [Streptosporangium canum]|uniref:hypothetical protein n=1 Tax=Streptosporangium canum TaxID=324952 RepID=UPI00343CA28C
MRTTISAGVLALALGGGIPMIAATTASAAAQVDCDNNGLLGGITSGLCKAVGTVGDVVGGLTGHDASPAAEDDSGATGSGADEGASADDAGSSRSAPAPDTKATTEKPADGGLLPKVLDDVCLPLVASPECASPSAISAPEKTEQPPARSHPRPSRSGRPDSAGKKPVPLPTEPLRPPETRTPVTDVGEPVVPQPPPVIDAEAPRVELLWPRPGMEELQRRMRDLQGRATGEGTVRPTRSSDTLGTVLTAGLLVVAILAVRLLYAKRGTEESMPFEPLRMGRQRTA